MGTIVLSVMCLSHVTLSVRTSGVRMTARASMELVAVYLNTLENIVKGLRYFVIRTLVKITVCVRTPMKDILVSVLMALVAEIVKI